MAEWRGNWAGDMPAEVSLDEHKVTCFKAPPGMFQGALIDLYNGTGEVSGEPGTSPADVRENVSRLLIGKIAMRAIVVDEHSVIRWEMDSRMLA